MVFAARAQKANTPAGVDFLNAKTTVWAFLILMSEKLPAEVVLWM